MSAQMVTVRAALAVLSVLGPKHYKELAKELFAANVIQPRGKDPEYTVYADLFFNSKSGEPKVVMIGRGVFADPKDRDLNGADYAPTRSDQGKAKEMTSDEITAEIARLFSELKAKDEPAFNALVARIKNAPAPKMKVKAEAKTETKELVPA